VPDVRLSIQEQIEKAKLGARGPSHNVVKTQAIRILGVDPGTLHLGVGVVEKQEGVLKCVYSETFEASNKLSLSKRLFSLYENLKRVVETYSPEVLVLEDVFFFKDFKAAIKIGEARSLAFLVAAEKNIEVVEYLPNRVKQSVVGNGHATKDQVQHMVQRQLNLKELPPPDSADALALAMCHFFQKKLVA
jgi:crossover junction endodeoxyribonuclease RuvC